MSVTAEGSTEQQTMQQVYWMNKSKAKKKKLKKQENRLNRFFGHLGATESNTNMANHTETMTKVTKQ